MTDEEPHDSEGSLKDDTSMMDDKKVAELDNGKLLTL